MANTPHLGITLLEQSQAQKEVTVNEAFHRIDALLNSGVLDKDLDTPPASPAQGDVYIVAVGATGAWAGKTGQVAYFDQVWRFIVPNEGLMLWVADENKRYVHDGSAWVMIEAGSGGSGGGDMDSSTYDPANISQQLVGTSAAQTLSNKTLTAPVINGSVAGDAVPKLCHARLTLTSGVAVTTSDVTGASTIYLTPHQGNQIALYDGSVWRLLGFTEIAHSLSGLTSGRPYDLFAYISSGAVAVERLAWTNDTSRATALALQHGVLVKSGDATRRYIGTFYSTGTTTTEDSKARRYLWNYYHRSLRSMASAAETALNWNYSTASYRQANANTANQVNYVVGVAEDVICAQVPAITSYNSTSTFRSVGIGIGLDSTTVNSASICVEGRCSSTVQALIAASYDEAATVGRHYLAWLEKGGGTDTQSFYPSIMGGYHTACITGRIHA